MAIKFVLILKSRRYSEAIVLKEDLREVLVLRWIQRLAITAAVILVLALLTGFVYEQGARRSVAQAFPPPGQLVEVDGKLSHLDCRGEGSPTVILEAGI